MESILKKDKDKLKIPLGVYIISIILLIIVLYWIISIIMIVIEMGSWNYEELQKQNPEKAQELKYRLESRGMEYNDNSIKILVLIGIIALLPLIILLLVIVIGIWKRKNWARITTIVVSMIFAGFSLFALIGSIALGNQIDIKDPLISLVLFGMGFYLLFDKFIKEYFKKFR